MVPSAVLQQVLPVSHLYFHKPVPCVVSFAARWCTGVPGMGNVGPACFLQHFSGALAHLPEYAQIQPEHMVGPPHHL